MAKGMPWVKWDLDDWCDDPELKTCSLPSQGILPRLMQIMARSDIYGYLRIGGSDPTQRQGRDGAETGLGSSRDRAETGLTLISRVSGVNHQTILKCLIELEEKGVLKRNERGLYSQRMLSDRDKWLKKHEDGKLGGNPALVNHKDNQEDNPEVKYGVNPILRTKNKEVRTKKEEQYTPGFLDFWEHYPRKIGKQKSFGCWQKLHKDHIDPDDLVSASKNYATYTKDTEPQFIKHPATFLGPSRAYEDFIDGYPDEDEGGEDIAEKIRRSQERVCGGKDTGERGRTSEPPY